MAHLKTLPISANDPLATSVQCQLILQLVNEFSKTFFVLGRRFSRLVLTTIRSHEHDWRERRCNWRQGKHLIAGWRCVRFWELCESEMRSKRDSETFAVHIGCEINSERVSADLMWRRAHVQISACSANVTASSCKHRDREFGIYSKMSECVENLVLIAETEQNFGIVEPTARRTRMKYLLTFATARMSVQASNFFHQIFFKSNRDEFQDDQESRISNV